MSDDIALRDGNRVPTLLFEENAEVRRVSLDQPLPVEQPIKTANRETTGNVDQILIQPSVGKRIAVKGVATLNEPALTGESRIYFAGGQLVHRVYGADQSGYIPMNISGQVDEALKVEVTNMGPSSRVFFTVNYVEE